MWRKTYLLQIKKQKGPKGKKTVLSGVFLHALLDAQHQMNEPVDLNHPALLPADLDLVQQMALRLLLAAAHSQRLPDVLNVLLTGQLGHAWSR